VPIVHALSEISTRVDTIAAIVLLGSTIVAACATRWRPWCAISLASLAFLVAGDQQRFQAWAYQYAATMLLLAARPASLGLMLSRGWTVSLYTHSALSKLDLSFLDGLGLVFLQTACDPLGLDPAQWPPAARGAAVLAMPAFELTVAAALGFARTRRLGLIGATVMHLALVLVLGPLGLGHSTIVLMWNLAMLAECWVAFGPRIEPFSLGEIRAGASLAATVFAAGVVWPFGERWGLCDPWPAHALYASHVERADVYLHESEQGVWPAAVRRFVATGVDSGDVWRRVDLTEWSRAERGTPVYPANRATVGLARGIAARYGVRLVRVVAFGPADRWTGRRTRREAIGLDALRALGRRFRLNARPADLTPGGGGS
jgi:hypothetical protein